MNAPLDPTVARKFIREYIAAGRTVFYTLHARQRMVERDVAQPEVLAALRSGWIGAAAYENGSWRYPVTANALCVVVALDAGIVVVTVIRR